jgi:hypothetical protein
MPNCTHEEYDPALHFINIVPEPQSQEEDEEDEDVDSSDYVDPSSASENTVVSVGHSRSVSDYEYEEQMGRDASVQCLGSNLSIGSLAQLKYFVERHIKLSSFLLRAGHMYVDIWTTAYQEYHDFLSEKAKPVVYFTHEDIMVHSTHYEGGIPVVDHNEQLKLQCAHTMEHIHILQQVIVVASGMRENLSIQTKYKWMEMTFGEYGCSHLMLDMCPSLVTDKLRRKVIQTVVFPLLHESIEHLTVTPWYGTPWYNTFETSLYDKNTFDSLHRVSCPCYYQTHELQVKASVLAKFI